MHFHLPALRAAGFHLNGIAGRPNSVNAIEVAKEFQIETVYNNAIQLIEDSQQFDALLIASSSDSLTDHLLRLQDLSIPVLVEKPALSRFEDFEKAEFKKLNPNRVMVGYNRRFYPSIRALKQGIADNGHGILNIKIPELSGSTNFSLADLKSCLRLNTVHIFDLLFFLFPIQDFKKEIFVYWNKNLPKGILVVFQNEDFLVNLRITFGTPGNYVFEYGCDNTLTTLEPLEKINHFSGMQIIEPTSDHPVRRYLPQRIAVATEAPNLTYKPGFLEQSKHFFELSKGLPVNGHASVADAGNVSKLVEEIVSLIDE